jgi:DinB family protein
MTTAAPGLRSPMLAQLLGELDRVEPRTRVAVTGLPESKFREVPPDGGWSVAQVFEHLCLSNRAYLDGPLPKAVAKAVAQGPRSEAWRPSFLGGWLTRMLIEGTKPVPTSRKLRVGHDPRANVVDDFLGSMSEVRKLMLEVDGHDLRVAMNSPILPILRMNVGDAFRIIVIHAHRHLGQAERTRRAVGM